MTGGDACEPAVVMIATFRRSQGLARLLSSLALQRGATPLPVVVNNDPDDPAPRAVAEKAKAEGLRVVFADEPERGISAARNRALALGLEEADRAGARFLAIIDDDETAPPGWLAAMIGAADRLAVPIVTGANEHRFTHDPPAWVGDSGLFERRSMQTGTRMPWAFTNNVLVRTEAMRAFAEREHEAGREVFDRRLGRVGGSDRHLFMRMRKAGHEIAWCDETATIEWNGPDRTDPAWIVRRKGRQGRSFAFTTRDVNPGPLTTLSELGRAGVSLTQGSAMRLASVFAGEGAKARARVRLAWGWGVLAGCFGKLREGYGS